MAAATMMAVSHEVHESHKFHFGASKHHKRRMSNAAEQDGNLGPSLKVRWWSARQDANIIMCPVSFHGYSSSGA
jgi:hypothetical protein